MMQKVIKSKLTPMNPRSKKSEKTIFGASMTIPGQALTPAELLKRHLAGTLPPIDLTKRYEYHYDEKGNQVAEPLPTELHEVHALSVAIRKRQYEEAIEHRKQEAEKHKEAIIAEYQKTHPKKTVPKEPVKTQTDSNPDPRFNKAKDSKKPTT